MKKDVSKKTMKTTAKTIAVILAALMVVGLAACSAKKEEPTVPESSAPAAEGQFSKNQMEILDAMRAEAKERVGNAGKPQNWKENPDEILAVAGEITQVFPDAFDLRSVDTNGDGIPENYVTSVKQQRPFGSCWSFATIAAVESSILYDLKQEAVITRDDGTQADAIDYSEHHLAWFMYTPVPKTVADSESVQLADQAGEGIYSQVADIEKNPSLRMGSGSTQFAASRIFASGMGPVKEPEFDSTEEPKNQLVYKSKEGNTALNERFNVICYSPDDDWSIDESLRFGQSIMLEDSYLLPSPVQYDEKGNYDKDYADAVGKLYKEQLANGRAVSICFCSDTYRPDQEAAAPKYINSGAGTWAHYTYEDVRANHAVTIIGWDDNYPASNFLSEVPEMDKDGKIVTNADGTPKMKTVSQPPANGAWIVKNSWGANNSIGQGITESNWGYNGTGYFYLSYYDKSIETAECFDFDVKGEILEALDKYVIDEYDLMPYEAPRSVVTSFPVSVANVFTTEEDEILKAVCCLTSYLDEEVKIEVYLLDDDPALYKDAELVLDYTKTFQRPGTHIVTLPTSVDIPKGKKYAISITQKTKDGYLFSVGSDYNQKGFDQGYCDDMFAAVGVVNPDESYIYLEADDTWWDFYEIKTLLEGEDGPTSYVTYDNFPIKGYASIKN